MSRRSPIVALALVAVVGAAVLAVDLVAPPASPAVDATAVASPAPVSGAWVCPVGDGRPGTELEVVAARPGGTGGQPAQVDVTVLDGGATTVRSLPELFPFADVRPRLDVDEDGAVAGRWLAGPVALTREWRLTDADDLPVGTIAGPCVAPFTDRWVVPGMSTVGSERARIRLANPFAADATVVVSFLVPEGREEPLALRNLTVPARDTLEVVVNDHLPERADLAAVIEVVTGRVAAEGYQVVDASIGEIDGATLVAAAAEAAEGWTIPWIADDEDRAAWLWVANPGERTATVELTMHTPDGGVVPVGLTEVSVPPGTLRRVDLADTLPEDRDEVALTARSEGVPVVVSGATAQTGDGPEATGFVVQLGAPVPDTSWVVSGGASEGRTERLWLVNPGGEPATAALRLFTGTTVQEPDGLQAVDVPAGAAIAVELTGELAGLAGWTAFVRADRDLVVGRVGVGGEEASHLLATLGVPAVAWRPPVTPLAGAPEPGLVTRLWTALGLGRDAASVPGTDGPAPVDGDDPDPDGDDLDPDG
jgi:hypothetical protein